jgi:hypothetical protein
MCTSCAEGLTGMLAAEGIDVIDAVSFGQRYLHLLEVLENATRPRPQGEK